MKTIIKLVIRNSVEELYTNNFSSVQEAEEYVASNLSSYGPYTRIETVMVSPMVPEVLDEFGEVITPSQEAVYESTEVEDIASYTITDISKEVYDEKLLAVRKLSLNNSKENLQATEELITSILDDL